MNDITIRDAQGMVDNWIHTIGGRYFSELTNMALLMEETGELARVIARVYGEQIAKEGDLRKGLAEEMADVMWVLMCLANQTGVDLTAAFEASLAKKTTRDKNRFHDDGRQR
jgi:NTP pyrophosphatase (non-canonical NTP hydrolase)